MKKRFTAVQVIRMLREAEAPGKQIRETWRRHNVFERRYSDGGGASEAGCARCEEAEVAGSGEDSKLMKILAEETLVIEG